MPPRFIFKINLISRLDKETMFFFNFHNFVDYYRFINVPRPLCQFDKKICRDSENIHLSEMTLIYNQKIFEEKFEPVSLQTHFSLNVQTKV